MKDPVRLISGFTGALLLAAGAAAYPGMEGEGHGASPHGAPSGCLVGPYTTNVTPTSARIRWVAKKDGRPGMLAYTSGEHKGRVETEVSAFTDRDKEVLHTAKLEGLKPGTVYRYVLHGAGGRKTGEFRTAPDPQKCRGPFRFVVYGDTRSRPAKHKLVADAIAKEEDLAFVVVTGDLVGDGEDWEEWEEQFFTPAAAYLGRAAVWPVRGNHEGDAVLYREHFALPGNELWYSFDYGNLHFVVLDSCWSGKAARAAMLEWLREDLAASDAEWTFVSYHHPTWNVGGHASRWGRGIFWPVLEKNGVDVVLAGHSHLYERFRPVGPRNGKPIIHIVTGGGGAPLYDAIENDLLEGGTGHSVLHYCVFVVAGNELAMEVRTPDGSVIDEMKLVKENGRYQKEVMERALVTGEFKVPRKRDR